MKVLYDDVIFRLQKVGGISNTFSKLISFAQDDNFYDVGYVSTTKLPIQNLHWSLLIKPPVVLQKRMPKFLVQFLQYRRLNFSEESIFHATYYNFPLKRNRKFSYVITIHDLGYEKRIMQSGFKRIVNIFFKKLAIKCADGIICVSQNTFDDLEKFYGKYLEGKYIRIIYNGVSDKFKRINLNGNKYSKYILFVGGRQKYKNFEDVVAAMSYFPEFSLLILGGGSMSKRHKEFLDKNLPNRYEFHCNITEEELNYFYNSAFCLVYPSSYEGFGLPIIEAMASGCPVIACSNSSIKEIAKDNAVLINDSYPQSIKSAINLLKNETYRVKLITKAHEYSKMFSWETTYSKTKQFYLELINSKS